MGFFTKKEVTVTPEETKVKECVINILKKENTRVSMAPLSKKYFISNKDIELHILIDGSAEVVKTTNHKFKYGWKFREEFINNLIDLAIDWIEKDRKQIEEDIFVNEINLLTDINNSISSLPDAPTKVDELKKTS